MTTEALFQQIAERLNALGEQVSEQRLKQIVNTELQALLGEQEFTRKMRFGAPEPKLVGSKFARWTWAWPTSSSSTT